jgi:dolichol kinase
MTDKIDQTPQISFGQELLRKGTHLGALIIPGSYYWLDLSRTEMLAIMVPAALAMTFIDISRLRRWGFWEKFARPVIGSMIRPHEKAGDFSGATYILATICVVVALFTKPVAVACLAFIMVGDTFAALIGRRWGRHRFGHKSYEGSLACLVSLLVVAWLTPDLALPIGVLGAVVATVTEALPWRIDDNVTVPLISGLVMTIALKNLALL